MFSPYGITVAILLYIGALFLIAALGEKAVAAGRNPMDHPALYSLSLLVYCTAWAYYGEIGNATQSGVLFISEYLAVTACAALSWFIYRKLIRAKNFYRITTIVDFLSIRYGDSRKMAAFVTLIMIFALLPYIALQIKAIQDTSALIMGLPSDSPSAQATSLITVALLTIFTILFGLRRLIPTERHPGMILALTVECGIKLMIFIIAGLVIIYGNFTGLEEIYARAEALPSPARTSVPASTWFAQLVISLPSILLLPRQFHVGVVECARESHLRTAIWAFPLLLFLINVLVHPIALAGMLLGVDPGLSDEYLLLIPSRMGQRWLSLVVFLGGISAATGMVMLETMAISTMISNHLVLPLLHLLKAPESVFRKLLQIRWAAAAAMIGASYLTARFLGKHTQLSELGMISFSGVFILFPAFVCGLFWREGNRAGAWSSLIGGLIVWLTTSAQPALIKAGILSPLGWFDQLTIASNAFFAVVLGFSFYFLGSGAYQASARERLRAAHVVDILRGPPPPLAIRLPHLPRIVSLEDKREKTVSLFRHYFAPEVSRAKLTECLEAAKVPREEKLTLSELSSLVTEVERALSAAIGSATAHALVKDSQLLTEGEQKELARIYGEEFATLRIPHLELTQLLHERRDREAQLAQEVEVRQRLLEQERAASLMAARAVRLKDDFIAAASHELNTPLTPLKVELRLIERETRQIAARSGMTRETGRIQQLLGSAQGQVDRMIGLIERILDVSRLSAGKFVIQKRRTNLSELALHALDRFRNASPDCAHLLQSDIHPNVTGNWDPARLDQLVTNLVSNALKFGRGRPILVRLQERQRQAILEVSDEGIGMDSQTRRRIFDRFEQGVSPNAFGGLGVGLYLCGQIVQAHGGTIEVQSQPGQGSKFTVVLPEQSPGGQTREGGLARYPGPP
ncbi:MAG: ATP-binding protein [Oligoflexia bacterium]|nr:ATP-binding protein [Oligoflexia bacterium]